MIDKNYKILDISFEIANNNYLIISTTGAGVPSEARDTILNLTSRTKKTMQRYELKKMLKDYKAKQLNWNGMKINEELYKYYEKR